MLLHLHCSSNLVTGHFYILLPRKPWERNRLIQHDRRRQVLNLKNTLHVLSNINELARLYIFVPLNAILTKRMDTQGNNSLRSRRKKGKGREKSAKEGKREGRACYKSRCFCIPPTVFWTNRPITSTVNT